MAMQPRITAHYISAIVGPGNAETPVNITPHSVAIHLTLGEVTLEAAQDAYTAGGRAGLIQFIREELYAEKEMRDRLWNWVGADRCADALLTAVEEQAAINKTSADLEKIRAEQQAAGSPQDKPKPDGSEPGAALNAADASIAINVDKVTLPAGTAIEVCDLSDRVIGHVTGEITVGHPQAKEQPSSPEIDAADIAEAEASLARDKFVPLAEVVNGAQEVPPAPAKRYFDDNGIEVDADGNQL